MSTSARAKAEELDRLLSGGAVREETPAGLHELARLAATVTEATPVLGPSADFRDSLRTRLLEADLQVAPPLGERVRGRIDDATARWRYSARAAVASAMASTLIGTTGMAVAAQAALPGDLLYGMKRGTEAVRLAFAATDVETGRLHLAFARERLDEVADSVAERSEVDLGPVFVDMDTASVEGANHLLQAASLGNALALTDELRAFTDEQRARLEGLIESLPADLRPAVDRSLEVLRRIDIQSGIAIDPACALCRDISPVTGAPVPPRVFLPGSGAAAPALDCDCGGDDPAPAPRDPVVVGDDGAQDPSDDDSTEPPGGDDSEEPDDDSPTPRDDNGDDDIDVVPSLPGPLDGVGDTVDDVVNDVVDDTGTGEVVSEVEDIVDEIIGGGSDLLDPLQPSDGPTGGLLP